eukprot:jgi/Chlat1/3453/Chrsp23S03772
MAGGSVATAAAASSDGGGVGKRPRLETAAAAKDAEAAGVSVDERVLKDIADIYDKGLAGGATGGVGLVGIAESPILGVRCHRPRRKVTVMIIGNHSAGKSSFINWYIGETIQRTGVAIETRGFSFITNGRKRETLKGDATLNFYEHLAGLEKFSGINHNLSTEVSPSKERSFSCTELIDTPGLVDGDLQYPFDVDSVIVWLADHADLILVFFDPIGQALCARTMDIIQRLNVNHAEKMKYYMSKADQNTHAFDLPTIYLPRPADDLRPPLTIPNAIEEVCDDINRAIRQTVQKNLGLLKHDCDRILARISEREAETAEKKRMNARMRNYGLALALLMLTSALASFWLVLTEICAVPIIRPHARNLLSQYPSQLTRSTSALLRLDASNANGGEQKVLYFNTARLKLITWLFGIYWVLKLAKQWIWRPLPVLSKRELAQLRAYKLNVQGILKIRDDLYKQFLQQLCQEL